MSIDIGDETTTLVRAKYPIIWIISHEEERVTRMLAKIAKKQRKDIFCWTCSQGLLKEDYKKAADGLEDPSAVLDYIKVWDKEQQKEGALFLLKDFAFAMENVMINRKLRDLHNVLKGSNKTVFIISPSLKIPLELQKGITVLDMPLPDQDEMTEIIEGSLEELRERAEDDSTVADVLRDLDKQYKERKPKLIQALMGLTADEAENVVAKCIVKHDLRVEIINSEKKQIIKKSGLLEFHEPSDSLDDVGGLENLKEWMLLANRCTSDEAKKYGLKSPRSILLIGPPGTGKSLCCKVIANIMKQPMLRLDMGNVGSKYYGETTGNIKEANKVSSAIAPVVMQYDEIEKMFSTGQGGEGHEETMRFTATVLTDFEENTAEILRVATSNSQNLRPELMQRFEAIFFVDLPNVDERKAIFAIWIKKIGRDPKKFDLDKLAFSSEGYVGREIRNAVNEALRSAFKEGAKDVTTDHIIADIKRIIPMSQSKKAEIDSMRKWAAESARNASKVAESKAASKRSPDVA